MNGEKDETRYFMPHPKFNTTFIELMPSTLSASSMKNRWIPNWRYLKFRCDIHEGPWFACFVLERAVGGKTSEAQAFGSKRKIRSVTEDLSSDGEWPDAVKKSSN